MEQWKEYKLGEILTIKYGKDHKRIVDGNIPIYGSGGVMGYAEDYLFDEDTIIVGRKGNIFQNNFDILLSMIEEKKFDIDITYNEELLEKVLKDFSAKLPDAMADNTYCIEENELCVNFPFDVNILHYVSSFS